MSYNLHIIIVCYCRISIIFAARNLGVKRKSRKITNSGCSVARLSRLVWDEEVAGSNPATPTLKAQFF